MLRTLVSAEKPIAARDGRWFTVRIMPYRTLEDRLDGVVITFVDITAAKTMEAEVRQAQVGLGKRVTEQSGELNKANRSLQAEIDKHKRIEEGAGTITGSDKAKAVKP